MPPHIAGEAHVGLLHLFFSTNANLLGIDHDDKISVVNMRCVGGFSFAAEEIGNFHRDMAECLIGRINHPPLAVNFLGFGREGPFVWHNVEG